MTTNTIIYIILLIVRQCIVIVIANSQLEVEVTIVIEVVISNIEVVP